MWATSSNGWLLCGWTPLLLPVVIGQLPFSLDRFNLSSFWFLVTSYLLPFLIFLFILSFFFLFFCYFCPFFFFLFSFLLFLFLLLLLFSFNFLLFLSLSFFFSFPFHFPSLLSTSFSLCSLLPYLVLKARAVMCHDAVIALLRSQWHTTSQVPQPLHSLQVQLQVFSL